MCRAELQIALEAGLVVAALWGGGCKKEVPRNGDGGRTALTDEDIADAVKMYVNAAAGNDGEYFVVFDEKRNKEVRLKPDWANCKTVGKVADNMYFACAEFVTADGDIYDLDIFVTGKSSNDLKFEELMIHSVNGKKRYRWYREGNLWKRKPVSGEGQEGVEEEGPDSRRPRIRPLVS